VAHDFAMAEGGGMCGEQVEAFAAKGSDTDVTVYDGEVESLSTATSAGLGIRVVVGSRQGFAYAGSLDPDVVEETLADARDNAAFGTPDEFLGLATPDGVPPAPLDLWRDELASFPTEAKVDLALDLERRVKAADARIKTVHSADYGDGAVEVAIASSTGVDASFRRTSCYLSVYALAGDDRETQTGGGYSVGRAPGDLSVDEACDDAVERATRMLGARKPASARVPVVLDTRVTATLLSILAGTLSGEAVLKGRSLFANRAGELVAAPMVVLTDDPTDPAAYGAAVFDAEGLACRRNRLISEGVLEGFLYDTYSGRRAGVPSTASAVRAGFKSGPGVGARAVSLEPGDRSQAEILAAVGDGLFVQAISGVHSGVNPVSGDFSVGAEGMLVRNGQAAEPVREITIASTIQRMLKDVLHIGNDSEWLPGSAAGVTLAIGEMSMSGA
ncbi:MAG TPA: TldD/PmbA family protein, partial [Acidimicrobiales bacterium]|nr:TldD/PmbA family protein [Acidimicrobiales bacterium]